MSGRVRTVRGCCFCAFYFFIKAYFKDIIILAFIYEY